MINTVCVLTLFFSCRHSTALWDLQDDFYLHNYHVKTGKGASHTMNTYQIAFGIDWQDGTDADAERNRSKASERSAILAESSNLPPRPLDGRATSRGSTTSLEGGESRRIANVRSRCVSQNQGRAIAGVGVRPGFSDSYSFLDHFLQLSLNGGKLPFRLTFNHECGCSSVLQQTPCYRHVSSGCTSQSALLSLTDSLLEVCPKPSFASSWKILLPA